MLHPKGKCIIQKFRLNKKPLLGQRLFVGILILCHRFRIGNVGHLAYLRVLFAVPDCHRKLGIQAAGRSSQVQRDRKTYLVGFRRRSNVICPGTNGILIRLQFKQIKLAVCTAYGPGIRSRDLYIVSFDPARSNAHPFRRRLCRPRGPDTGIKKQQHSSQSHPQNSGEAFFNLFENFLHSLLFLPPFIMMFGPKSL